MDWDVVIIGGGPAGLTAGIYCVRRKLKTVVVERMTLGGQMLLASEVGNWPGDKLVAGGDLAARMSDHARSLGVEFIFDEAVALKVDGEIKEVTLRGKKITCGAVILATGGQHKKMKITGEEEFSGRGVSYCATCDAPFFKDKRVAVVGSGNMAVEDALYLNEISSKVYLIAKSITAEEVLQEKLEKSSVKVVSDTVVEIFGSDLVESVKLASETILKVDGVFISAGTTPSSELANNSGVELDERGFIKVNRDMETNVKGVYAAGDVTGGIPQIASAVGEGCTAALRSYGYIKNGK